MIGRDIGHGNVRGQIQNWAEETSIAFQEIQPGMPEKKCMLNAEREKHAMNDQDSATN